MNKVQYVISPRSLVSAPSSSLMLRIKQDLEPRSTEFLILKNALMISVNLVRPESILVSTIAKRQHRLNALPLIMTQSIYSGVDYDSSIYEVDFINRAAPIPNENSIRGGVDYTI